MKNTAEEVSTAASSCFKLNSMQLRCLLMKYQYDSDEAPISPEILENVVRVCHLTFYVFIFYYSFLWNTPIHSLTKTPTFRSLEM